MNRQFVRHKEQLMTRLALCSSKN